MRCPKSIIVALGLLAGAAQAEIYTWQDEQGRTHYGDRPPAGAEARQLDIESGVSTVGGTGLREGEKAMLDELAERDKARASQPVVQLPPPLNVQVGAPARDYDDDRVILYSPPGPYRYWENRSSFGIGIGIGKHPYPDGWWPHPKPHHPRPPYIDPSDRPLPWPEHPPRKPPVPFKPAPIGISPP
ncbi:MAG TPA: DUF4124 domain-containing protein [Candidatus Competibacteraceae bacterium]|nr:DUF4124 domain-containing protein [Candidatus Competibacteraceae bacterium]